MVRLACTPPSEHHLPTTHWTHAALAEVAIATGVVDRISAETVRQWLSAMALKPHRSRCWLNSPDPEFEPKMRDIVRLYLDPPNNSIVLCFDERTGMQALERKYPTKPMRPGLVERREFEYVRHGTMDLLAALHVHTGQVYGICSARHTQVEVAEFFGWLLPQMPRRKQIHLVMDNLRVHQTERVQRVLGRYRRRLHLHWLPVHASWLNQIELFFSILQRRVLRRGDFSSQGDLANKVVAFIEWYDVHQAKPFRWTYTGDPLAA